MEAALTSLTRPGVPENVCPRIIPAHLPLLCPVFKLLLGLPPTSKGKQGPGVWPPAAREGTGKFMVLSAATWGSQITALAPAASHFIRKKIKITTDSQAGSQQLEQSRGQLSRR